MEAYYIEFNDTRYVSCGWITTDELAKVKPSTCFAVGFVVYQDNERVNLVMCHNCEDSIQGFAIPRRAITKMIPIPESVYLGLDIPENREGVEYIY